MNKKRVILGIAIVIIIWFLFSLIRGCNTYSGLIPSQETTCTCIGTIIKPQPIDYIPYASTTDYCVGLILQKTTIKAHPDTSGKK